MTPPPKGFRVTFRDPDDKPVTIELSDAAVTAVCVTAVIEVVAICLGFLAWVQA